MKAMLAPLKARYLKLARRERGLALLAALVLIGGLGEMTLIDPMWRQRTAMLRAIDSEQAERAAFQATQINAAPDPEVALRSQLATLQTQINATDGEFRSLQTGLVQPQHMGQLLQSLLGEHRSLQLVGLKSLPVRPLTDELRKTPPTVVAGGNAASSVAPAASGATADDAWLYRHAVEIKVQGSYADMLAYLKELESLPRHVHWGDLEIDARGYPTNVMTVTIFTVSLEKTWWVL